jgi:hypothetical protein
MRLQEAMCQTGPKTEPVRPGNSFEKAHTLWDEPLDGITLKTLCGHNEQFRVFPE